MIYLLSPSQREGCHSLPMIEFSLVAKEINFSNIDYLMFTSKQAVVSANTIDKNWKNYPCIAIGGATKSKIEALGGEVIYYPKEFYGKNLSQDIKAYFADKKILYLRPREISFNSKAYLAKEGITLKEQIIYETSCVMHKHKTLEKNAIIIFTSPSTIKCFFKNFIWNNSFTAILIGEATKEHLPSYCQYVVADEPLIDACVKKAKELEKN